MCTLFKPTEAISRCISAATRWLIIIVTTVRNHHAIEPWSARACSNLPKPSVPRLPAPLESAAHGSSSSFSCVFFTFFASVFVSLTKRPYAVIGVHIEAYVSNPKFAINFGLLSHETDACNGKCRQANASCGLQFLTKKCRQPEMLRHLIHNTC